MTTATANRGDEEEEPAVDVLLELFKDSVTAALRLHRSLFLAEILRNCFGLLQERFSLSRLSLIQLRNNDSIVTFYSLDAKDADLIGPEILALEPSRLRKCITGKEVLTSGFEAAGEMDAMERKYLVPAGSRTVRYSPLLLDEKFKAVLVIALSRTADWEAHRTFLAGIHGQLTLALENSDIHYMECRRGRQLAMVSEIAKLAVLVEDLSCFLSGAAERIRVSLDYLQVGIWTRGSGSGNFRLEAGACKETAANAGTVPSEMIARCFDLNRSLCENNLPASSDAGPDPAGAASRLAVPIRLRGKVLGVLTVESTRLDAFPEEDRSTMEGVASLIASVYDNLRVFAYAQQSNRYMHATLEAAKHLAILSTDTQGCVITSSVGSEPIFRLSRQEIVGRDLLTLFPDSGFRQELASYIEGRDLRPLEKAKLTQPNGERQSYLNVTVQRVFDPVGLALGFLCIVEDVTSNFLLEQKLEELSVTDELTGLYNRRRFFHAVDMEMRRSGRFNRPVSLCFFDLDGFKQYNDTYGHLQGDQALKATADLILSMVRSNVDSCYRYGGDEFTVIMPDTDIRDALRVSERIRMGLSEHFRGEITSSIGIATSTDSTGVEDLIEKADRAMYSAKAAGGNRVVFASEGRLRFFEAQ